MRFVDTSFWVALQFRRDNNHEQAVGIWREGGPGLVTSNHVIGETWTFLRRRVGHAPAVAFLDLAGRSSRLGIRRIEEPIEVEALEWLRRHDEGDYSFVDATSFALMRRTRIAEALAFEGDFSAAGFVEVRI